MTLLIVLFFLFFGSFFTRVPLKKPIKLKQQKKKVKLNFAQHNATHKTDLTVSMEVSVTLYGAIMNALNTNVNLYFRNLDINGKYNDYVSFYISVSDDDNIISFENVEIYDTYLPIVIHYGRLYMDGLTVHGALDYVIVHALNISYYYLNDIVMYDNDVDNFTDGMFRIDYLDNNGQGEINIAQNCLFYGNNVYQGVFDVRQATGTS